MRPYLRVANVFEARIDTSDVLQMNFTPEEYEIYRLKPGDILLNEGQSLEWVGRPAIYRGEVPGACFQNTLIRFRAYSFVLPEFALLVFRAYLHSQRFQKIAKWTTNIAHLGAQRFADLEFPVPPLAEQKRIVAGAEKLLSQVDAGVKGLKRLQANLKRYRASVLKAACEGRLVPTEAELAQAEGRDYEPASKLLDCILEKHRSKWEADHLEKLKKTGKAPKDEGWRSKYNKPPDLELKLLPELPDGWAWASVAQVAAIQGGIQKQPSRAPKKNSYPFLRVANVLRGSLDLIEVHRIELFEGELGKLQLQKGDLLVVEGNGSANEIGRMAIWDGSIPHCVHQNHIIRLRPFQGVLPEYIAAYWNSPEGTSRVLAQASSTSGLFTLSVSKIGGLVLPIPPVSEQVRIVAEVERVTSVVRSIEAIVSESLIRAGRLRQSTLNRAFEGKLVPQDPSEESAIELIERIGQKRGSPVSKSIPEQLSLHLEKSKRLRTSPRSTST